MNDSLIGKFYHKMGDNGKPDNMIVFFSWVTGLPNGEETISKKILEKCIKYNTPQELNKANKKFFPEIFK